MGLHSLRQSYRGFAAVVAQPLRHVARKAILEDVDYDADSINKVQLKGKMLEDLKPYRVDQLTFARGRMQLSRRREDKCDQIFHVEVIGPAAEVAQASIHAGDYVYVEGGLSMERVSAPAGQQQEVDVPMVIIKAYNLTKGFPPTQYQNQDSYNIFQQQQQQASSQINYGVASPAAPSPPPPPAQQQPAAPAYGARNASHGSRQPQMQQAPPAATPQQQPAVPRYGSGDGYRRGKVPAAPVATPQQASPPASAPEQAMQQPGGTRSFPDNSHLWNASIEDKWLHVRDNPKAWFDNRTNKTNPKAPDFKLKGKDINVALWVTSKDTPQWARDMFGAQTGAY